MTRQSLPYSLFRTIHRAKRQFDADVRKALLMTPSVILALMSILFIALLLTAMQAVTR